jgi:predicted amidohydrolase YtcJ
MIAEPQSGDNGYSRAVGKSAHADLVLVNAKVITVDPRFSLARAVGARGGRIAVVGEDVRVREQGSIEPGKRADFVVLSEDPLTVSEERLPGIVADLTVAGGRVVYERAGG